MLVRFRQLLLDDWDQIVSALLLILDRDVSPVYDHSDIFCEASEYRCIVVNCTGVSLPRSTLLRVSGTTKMEAVCLVDVLEGVVLSSSSFYNTFLACVIFRLFLCKP